MVLNKERFGILVLFLVVAGGILVLQGQQNKASLTADISQVADNKNAQESSVQVVAPSKVWVSPSSVSAGKDITVTVDTRDISNFILFVDVYIESANSGETGIGTLVNIDGEGRSFGNITIPSGSEQGTWVIKRVSIRDMSGSTTDYHDGQDISASFTVTSP